MSYQDEIGEKVLKVLQTAGRLDMGRVTEIRQKNANIGAGKMLEALILNDAVDEDLVLTVLSRAYAIRRLALAVEAVEHRAMGLIPAAMIDEHQAMPFAIEGRFLKIAIVDPTTASLSGQFKSLSNFNIEFQLIGLKQFRALRHSDKVIAALEKKPPKPQQLQSGVRHTGVRHTGVHTGGRRNRFPADNDELVPEICDHILIAALASNASDIHIELFRTTAQIRFRIDGRLTVKGEYSDYVTRNYLGIITRFKIMADCDIAEKRLPQDGAIAFKYGSEDIDFRFSVLPCKNGERIVMRILKGDAALSLDKIGLSAENLKRVTDAITAPQGMVLVTGPTGSGKTTTLYGALHYINTPEINILTAEDPVEYYLEGIGQVQANEKIGLSFSSILRSFLRQDPEVILVGEIRDSATVDIAVKAALTGHLLLSTLHTNDAIATITRLINMGVPPFMITAAVSLIIGQRLARTNCTACLGDDATTTPEMLGRIGFKEAEIGQITAKKGSGCGHCGNTGYRGRQGIYEVLPMNPRLEEAILSNALAPELLAAAKDDGFETMQDIGRGMIKDGHISVEEYTRVLVLD